MTGVSHALIAFDDGNACTVDACDPTNGVSHLPVTIDDNDKCTTDSCDKIAGVKHLLVAIDDNNLCTTDACDPQAGVSHTAVSIDDGDACTLDSCSALGGVVHPPVNIDDNNACTIDGCNPISGVSHQPVTIDDGDVCTTDSCNKTLGVSHAPVVCNDSNACTTDSCKPAIGCVYTQIDPNDNNACTTDGCDVIQGPIHTAISCNDSSACTVDSCNQATGCVYAPIVYYTESFASNAAGWTLGTAWGIGPATASTGQLGGTNPDPALDHTATADNGVAGVVIGGNLPTTPTQAPVYLTSPPIDLTGVTTPTTLEFYRWLNSDSAPFMINYVDVFDGVTWINVFTSGGLAPIADAAWTKIQYNVPASALNKAGVRVRFGYAVASGSFVVSSWNIDDIRLLPGAVPNACP
jgi:hypothetical protein